MKILSIIIFGFALVRTMVPLLLKENYSTFGKFFGTVINIGLYLVCYIWFLNLILNES